MNDKPTLIELPNGDLIAAEEFAGIRIEPIAQIGDIFTKPTIWISLTNGRNQKVECYTIEQARMNRTAISAAIAKATGREAIKCEVQPEPPSPEERQ